jgi:hypothetical protein
MSPRVMLDNGRLPNISFKLVIEIRNRFHEFGWEEYSPCAHSTKVSSALLKG